jgi:hypothetical protein
MLLRHYHHTSNTRDAKIPSSTTMTSRNPSTTSTNTTSISNEQTSLLSHEQGPSTPLQPAAPKHHHPPPTKTSTTKSVHQTLTLHPDQIAILEALRAEDEAAATEEEEEEAEEETNNRHVLSRIDRIEIDLWHERIRDYEAAELGLLHADELGLVRDSGEEDQERDGNSEDDEEDEVYTGRLSRQHTYVNDFADAERGGYGSTAGKRRKVSSIAHTARLGSTSLSLDHFHPYFWVDMLGICVLIILILMFLVLIGLEIRYDRESICGEEGIGAQGFWIAVQMVVALGMGLILQVPVHRGLVPFVLPLWALGTAGTVVGFKALAGCLSP